MKKNIFLPAFLLSLLTFGYAHAESIVMKNTVYGLEALSDEDIQTHGQVISDILLKYCWPMCQDSDLTPEEQHELLSPEGNEERFLEKKLNETIPLSRRDFEFAVVFVPTTLYELFCISKKNELYPRDAIAEANRKNNYNFPSIWFRKISTKSDPKILIRVLQEFNNLFYPDHVLKSHQLFVTFLSEAGYFSDSIKSLNLTLIQDLINKKNVQQALYHLLYNVNISTINERIPNYIECESKAHTNNKGLISRGSNLLSKGRLASTICDSFPHSISFGSSLFAGSLNDIGACVCKFLRTEYSDAIGYTIFIDKHKYYQNKIDNLFFIPALSTLSGLFASGEFFHPRSQAATIENLLGEGADLYIRGIVGSISDEGQLLTIKRGSLEHELKFLKYFIDNFEIFVVPGKKPLKPEEKQTEILHAQCEAFVKAKEKQRNFLFKIMYLPQPVMSLTEGEQLVTKLLDFVKKTRQKRQEQLARVLNAIAEVAAKAKQEQSVSAKLATAQEQVRNRIQTISRHLSKVFSKL